jgi:hypothetical protein
MSLAKSVEPQFPPAGCVCKPPSHSGHYSYCPLNPLGVIDNTGCPVCLSDDYIELDEDQLAAGGYSPGDPVHRCEECGEEWS